MLAICLFVGCAGPGAELVNGPAPELGLPDLSASIVHLSDFRGKVVLLDFWATWCGPCAASIPFYESLYHRDESKGLVVIGINEDDNRSAVDRFVREHSLRYLVLLDPGRRAYDSYGVEGLPTAFLIDRDGRIVQRWLAFDDKTRADVDQRVAASLEQRSTAN